MFYNVNVSAVNICYIKSCNYACDFKVTSYKSAEAIIFKIMNLLKDSNLKTLFTLIKCMPASH